MSAIDEISVEMAAFRDAGLWESYKPGNISAICAAIGEWLATQNPFFMDFALEMAFERNAPITQGFQKQIVEASKARRQGTAIGTYMQVERHVFQEFAYRLICCLRFVDTPIEEASSKAANWLDNQSNGRFTYTAASLERMYQENYVKTGRADELHKSYAASGANTLPWHEVRLQLSTSPNKSTVGARR